MYVCSAAAASDLLSHGMPPRCSPFAGAVQTLCAGGLFDRARQLAGGNPQLLQLIDDQHTQRLVASNDAEELASMGNAAAAAELFAAQGNWPRAHQLVRTRHVGPAWHWA